MDKAEEARLTAHQRKWLGRIQACEASGMGVAAYAAEYDFPVRAMYDAKKVLVKKGVLPRTRRSQFQRVQTAAVTVGGEWRIQLPNGVSVDFSGTVDAGSLSTVLNMVARLG
jgi:hypothetical protein